MSFIHEYSNDNSTVAGYILNEHFDPITPKIIEKKQNSVVFNAIIQDADNPNRNKRRYASNVLAEGLATPYIAERIKTKSLLGEAGHPMTTDPSRQMIIDQLRVSHIICNPHIKDGKVKSVIETANTTAGRDMMGLINQGVSVAFSMRGFSKIVKEDTNGSGVVDVLGPLFIVTYDWVIHPSHACAYMESSINESTKSMLLGKDLGYNLLESNFMINEIVPLQNNELVKHVIESSSNFKRLTDFFEYNIDKSTIRILENKQYIDVHDKSDGTILRVCLEKYIKEDIDDYLSSLK